MGGVIRDARLDDAAELARIHVASWQAAYRGLIDQSFLDSLNVADRTDNWSRILRQTRGRALVAESNGEMVGFCVVGPSLDLDWGEVYSIYLAPQHWGQGHGRELLAAAEQALADSGHHRAMLWVLDTNHRARAFYERQGWVIGKPIRIENIGGRDVNKVRYEKALAPP